MTSSFFFSFMTALLLCMALIPPLRLLAERWRFLDQPGERKVHEQPIPRVGGIAFGVAACAAIAWWVPKTETTMAVLLGGLIILGFGVWDDRVNLSYRVKLFGQAIAALAVILAGDIRFESVPFLLDGELPAWVGIPVTMLFLVGVSNAVNLTDGLDGLAGGLSFLTLCGIAYLAYLSNDTAVLALALPFLGGVLGFLRYNTYPARIFMGDGGSQLLGFIMGVLAVLLTTESRGPFSQGVSLFLLGLPFLDTFGVSAQRIAEGRSPFVGDRKHIHHKLMTAGLTHYEAVTAIYGIQGAMVGAAYLLRWESDATIISLYLALAGIVLALFIAAGHGLFPKPGPQSVRVRSNQWLADMLSGSWLADMPIRFLAVIVPLFLVGTVFLPAEVPSDVGYLSIGLFGVVLVGLAFLPELAPYFVRGGLYLGSTFLLYVSDEVWLRAMPPVPGTYHLLFGAMAAMVLLSMRFDSRSRFQTTPLDYLMVCLAVIVPFLPEVRPDMSMLGLFAAKLIVLFFSFELLLHAFSDRVKQLGLVSLWILFGLGLRLWI
jgi:UDP-GlcNAc:undecaprenyl-phosphate GlcNAc-1-phosphate transferase